MANTTIEDVLTNVEQFWFDEDVEMEDATSYVRWKDVKPMIEKFAASLNRQGWTRVETELPAQGESVLVYCEGGLIEKGYRIGSLWERDWAGTTFHEAGYTVTHWMPLPNKPE